MKIPDGINSLNAKICKKDNTAQMSAFIPE